MIHGQTITRATSGFSEIHDITTAIQEVADESGLTAGLVNVFAIGSTASITTLTRES